ncbi:MAG: cytochrome c biogenesis protein CcdA [Desulfobacterium sp.]|nr:cytochrome c biogenesis protein CcdA [Desulfobacterium sp.]MBU3947250.1 cytochrome c biogenesis CcdA family protein [Pseudomonadota bacterium]MBU4009422.1 cytochrome c biogenesis CcdA family protein [Pseudomonadota bacterium]MBU4036510.1 cytochrome c biogenesis CcdA family protein [Pseudomonadota bacterium]
MIESFFLTVNQWMTGGATLAFLGCFLWGIISVMFSPCHLASIPLIIAYVAGQEKAVDPRQAVWYAGAFTLGLFITIALIGIVCSLLGRMLGDVGIWWQILVGGVLLLVALNMLGVEFLSVSGSLLYRLKLKGIYGAFGLGLAYGILSGSCTFGFIAPILAIITIQQKILTGIVMIVLFALGHCLPIVAAGSSSAWVRKLTENSKWQNYGNWFRKGAGVIIGFLGLYFIINPFLA